MWVLNAWLFLNFIFNHVGYIQLVEAGVPCMAAVDVGNGLPTNPAPACWYDPSNVNPPLQ